MVVGYFMSKLLSKNISCWVKENHNGANRMTGIGAENQIWDLPNLKEVAIIPPATFKCYIPHALNYELHSINDTQLTGALVE
jgi:hypothetical protein